MAYQPLQTREIRLLRLLPKAWPIAGSSSSTTTPSPCCELMHASLDSLPEFEALSYAWGHLAATKPIILDGQPFVVSTSLYHALRDLEPNAASRTLWIDALCINQTDVTEKEEQVALMRHIYQLASSVTVYLGEAWEGLDLAFGFLREAAAHRDYHYEASAEPHLVVHGHDAGSPIFQENLVRFLELPWWKRLWTAQEYILGRVVTFQCGQSLLGGEIFRRAYSNLRWHEFNCCWDSPSVKSSPIFGPAILRGFFNMDATETGRERSGGHNPIPLQTLSYPTFAQSLDEGAAERDPTGQATLLSVPYKFLFALDNFRTRDSTDPRDKIYGITGLYYQDEVAKLFTKPNYSLSIEELYTHVAHTIIREMGTLEVLSRAAGYHPPRYKLPSFVPDWSVSLAIEDDRRSHLSETFDASRGHSADWTVLDSRSARTKAVFFDSITQLGRCLEYGTGAAGLVRDWAALAGMGDSEDNFRNETGIFARSSSFWRTISGSKLSFRLYGEDLTTLIDLAEPRDYAEEVQHGAYLKWYAYAAGHSESKNTPEVARFQFFFEEMSVGRVFGVTKDGRLGMFPRGAGPGDAVVVMPGGKVPYVLREVAPGTYEVVGEAYVHGVMAGEAFDEAKMASVILV